jgi:hypothetical protein
VNVIALGAPGLQTAATVVAFAASLLLVDGGASKVRSSAPASRALAAAKLPSSAFAARALGVAEVAIGGLFLAAPGAASATLLAAIYVAFGAFLTYLLVGRVAATTCGCAGERDLPPSWLHVALDLVAATAAIVAAFDPPEPILRFAGTLPLAGIPILFGLLLIAWLAMLVVVYVPALFRSYQRTAAA